MRFITILISMQAISVSLNSDELLLMSENKAFVKTRRVLFKLEEIIEKVYSCTKKSIQKIVS